MDPGYRPSDERIEELYEQLGLDPPEPYGLKDLWNTVKGAAVLLVLAPLAILWYLLLAVSVFLLLAVPFMVGVLLAQWAGFGEWAPLAGIGGMILGGMGFMALKDRLAVMRYRAKRRLRGLSSR